MAFAFGFHEAGNDVEVENLDVEGWHTADKQGKTCRTPCLRSCVHTESLAWGTSCLVHGLLCTDALTGDYSLVDAGQGSCIP